MERYPRKLAWERPRTSITVAGSDSDVTLPQPRRGFSLPDFPPRVPLGEVSVIPGGSRCHRLDSLPEAIKGNAHLDVVFTIRVTIGKGGVSRVHGLRDSNRIHDLQGHLAPSGHQMPFAAVDLPPNRTHQHSARGTVNEDAPVRLYSRRGNITGGKACLLAPLRSQRVKGSNDAAAAASCARK